MCVDIRFVSTVNRRSAVKIVFRCSWYPSLNTTCLLDLWKATDFKWKYESFQCFFFFCLFNFELWNYCCNVLLSYKKVIQHEGFPSYEQKYWSSDALFSQQQHFMWQLGLFYEGLCEVITQCIHCVITCSRTRTILSQFAKRDGQVRWHCSWSMCCRGWGHQEHGCLMAERP